MLAESAPVIIREIEAAFGQVQHPGDHLLLHSQCMDDSDIEDFYGRFDLAYDNLRYFMGDTSIAGPVFVDSAVAGDPGNNGSSEQGTSALPFNTIHEATYAVRSGDEVRIQPGNYNQQFRIWRPMTLKRAGSSGTVRIGD